MTTVGSGRYSYEVHESWATLPTGWTFGPVSAVATDSQDRVYAFQRKDPPVVVFDRDGNYLRSWGSSAITDPHGISIDHDIVYLTDRDDHVALKFTLDGKPLMVLGKRGQPSDTGAVKDIELPPRSAGPFNKPTEMVAAPSGDLPRQARHGPGALRLALGPRPLGRFARRHLSRLEQRAQPDQVRPQALSKERVMILERFKVPEKDQVLVDDAALRRTVTQIFEKLGVSPDDAAEAGEVLTMTDLRGVETHGVSKDRK